MSKTKRISNNTLAVIVGMIISIGFIFMGLDLKFPFGTDDVICSILTLGGFRHTMITILYLILIPLCALEKRYAFIVVMITGIVTFALCFTHVIYMLIAKPFGYEAQLYGPVIWSIIQIPITVFSHRARQELTIT
jgi:hypothetical protein